MSVSAIDGFAGRSVGTSHQAESGPGARITGTPKHWLLSTPGVLITSGGLWPKTTIPGPSIVTSDILANTEAEPKQEKERKSEKEAKPGEERDPQTKETDAEKRLKQLQREYLDTLAAPYGSGDKIRQIFRKIDRLDGIAAEGRKVYQQVEDERKKTGQGGTP
jgi:hypothetical protein